MITSRTLNQWRRDALKQLNTNSSFKEEGLNIDVVYSNEFHSRILRLTQELLDIQLLRKDRKSNGK